MANKWIQKSSRKGYTELSVDKKPYAKPVFQVYGKLHRVTQGTGTVNGDGGPTMMIPSDPNLKENVVRVGNHPLGIGLYLFDYKPEYRERCGYGRQFGIMANEVEKVMPSAVSIGLDGYRVVNYGMIGISLPS